MARLVGVTIPDTKSALYALTSIHGIGLARSKTVLSQANIAPEAKVKDLQPDQLNAIKDIIQREYKIEGDLRREKTAAIKRLRDIGSWRGMRHTKGLPARGQRTKTNNRTVRGNKRRTMGSGRNKSTK